MDERMDLIIRDGDDQLVVAGPLRLWTSLVDSLRGDGQPSGAAPSVGSVAPPVKRRHAARQPARVAG
jgi:hypothetical protein